MLCATASSCRRLALTSGSFVAFATKERYRYKRARRGNRDETETPVEEVILLAAASKCPSRRVIPCCANAMAAAYFSSFQRIRTCRLNNHDSTSRHEAMVRNVSSFLASSTSMSMLDVSLVTAAAVTASASVAPTATSRARPDWQTPVGSRRLAAAAAISSEVALPDAPEAVPNHRRTTLAGFVYVYN